MYNNLFKNYSKNYLQIGGAEAQTLDERPDTAQYRRKQALNITVQKWAETITLDELEIYVTRVGQGTPTITIRGLDKNRDLVLHFQPNQILNMNEYEYLEPT